MNNLFLEGPIQTGKSTLIRTILKGHCGAMMDGVGGFTSQRVIRGDKKDNRLLGFCLAEASAPIETSDCAEELLFKRFTEQGPKVDLNIFETTGLEYLRDSAADFYSRKINIILLDEIGGHEMLCPKFREALFELIDSKIPCIGVLKLEESARKMVEKCTDRTAGQILEYNEKLRKRISGNHEKMHGDNCDIHCSPNNHILSFTREDVHIEKLVDSFVYRAMYGK